MGADGSRGPGGGPGSHDAARAAGPGAGRGGLVTAVARAVAAVIPAAALARLGLSALITAAALAVCVLATACWVLASDARAGRAAMVPGPGAARPPRRPPSRLQRLRGRRDGGGGSGASDPSRGTCRSKRLPDASVRLLANNGVERVVERVAARFKWNQCFRRHLPSCLCR